MSGAISVEHVTKRFRIPLDRSTTLKYRFAHPLSTSRYRELLALSDVGFEVPFGQFLGIIGHNGSGKSTLLKILSRIYRPTAGEVQIDGFVSPFLELGVGFHGDLTARENVYLNGTILGLSRRELSARMEEIIGFAELENFVDQKLKNFSSGMQVRLAFSVAIQAGAGILVMDEVLAVGDAHFQDKCFEVFARYKREGRTVVLVTHDLPAVDRYCDRALLLDEGRLVGDGRAADITAQYRRLVSQRWEEQAAQPALSGVRPFARRPDVEILEVRVLDREGRAQTMFTSGAPLTVEIQYRVNVPLPDFTCGLEFSRSDGLQIGEARGGDAEGAVVRSPQVGTGTISYRIDRLPLLGGAYGVTVSLHDAFAKRSYDQLERPTAFRVVDEAGRTGLVEMAGRWASPR